MNALINSIEADSHDKLAFFLVSKLILRKPSID